MRLQIAVVRASRRRCCTARSKLLTSLCRSQSHPGAARIGHPERGHLVEYLAPNSVFNSLPRQRSSPHLRPDDRFVTIDRVPHHASLVQPESLYHSRRPCLSMARIWRFSLLHGRVRILTERRVSLRRNHHARPSSRAVRFDGFVDRFLVVCTVRRHRH